MSVADAEQLARDKSAGIAGLSLAALGVVYGDIGTSPLYALREALHSAARAGTLGPQHVLGLLSLISWTLFLIVTVKYVLILLRADNEGEGGTLSLLALALRALPKEARSWLGKVILILGLVGAALFFGDAAITPAISVLSAVEGIGLILPEVQLWVVPLALAALWPLFLAQSRGTAVMARLFGPIMLLWFVVMAVGGLSQIVQNPAVLQALNPLWAARFLWGQGALGLLVLGAVFLAVTGAEALYADMGHFGRRPIHMAWLLVACPALLLNYFGQGALILARPEAMENPFYLLFPEAVLPAVVVLATLATIIASQAVISGAFSLTRQAVQMRLLPRLRISHTSEEHEGQIYLPVVNWLLAGLVTVLVVGFGSSSALASAYGIAVTGTMVVTSLLAMVVLHYHWGWSRGRTALVMVPFIAIELVFLAANMMKILEGGWLPLLIAATVMTVMLTWRRGRNAMRAQERKFEMPLAHLLTQLASPRLATVPGTAVYLTPHADLMPAGLLHSLKHFHVVHERIVILSVETANIPHVAPQARAKVTPLSPKLLRVELTFGYAEVPDVPRALMRVAQDRWQWNIMTTSFMLSARRLRLSSQSALPAWQARLFIGLARNARDPADYFRIPSGRVVELGAQIAV